jgi:hypothetical protein
MSSSSTAVRLVVGGAVLLGLALSGNGLSKTAYFERTPDAIIMAREGNRLLLIGCGVLIVCAAVVVGTGPHWAALLIAAPAVVVGGLALAASETFLPQIAALPTFVLAVVGTVGVILKRGSD